MLPIHKSQLQGCMVRLNDLLCDWDIGANKYVTCSFMANSQHLSKSSG